MQLTINNVKLVTYDLNNNTEEKLAKTHRDNIINTFIQKIKITNTVETITRLVENEPRLEDSAIKNMIRTDVNK